MVPAGVVVIVNCVVTLSVFSVLIRVFISLKYKLLNLNCEREAGELLPKCLCKYVTKIFDDSYY